MCFNKNMDRSITETFKNGTFLVTGSTGFLGKILIEKLLRSCSLKKLVIIVRSNKEISSHQRVKDLYKQAIFDRLRMDKPDFMNYIKVIDGDLKESTICSSADRQWLIENVNFVFHCAAAVKFNEPLETAFKINVQGTEHTLALAMEIQNLKGFVHVSTAYSHCPRNEINEQYYPSTFTATELKNIISSNQLIPDILGGWPNTYTFTKSIAENLISMNASHLPISIFRPSIIGCSVSDPDPGWTEIKSGPTVLISSRIAGVLKTVHLDLNKVTDIIPIDYTANALIGVMWDTVKRYRDQNAFEEKPKIYNYVSSPETPVTWNEIFGVIDEVHKNYPLLMSIWYKFCICTTHSWLAIILRFLLHRIPAAFVDLSLLLFGKKTGMLKMYQKLEFSNIMMFEFLTREWKFNNSNTRKLWSSLNQEDRQTFFFSLDRFDWNSYLTNYCNGVRKYILKEDLSNLEKVVAKHRKLFWWNNLCTVLIICIAVQICWTFIK